MFSLVMPVCWAAPQPNPLSGNDIGTQLVAAKKKKKKTKHNYYSLDSFNVSGDQNNADASIVVTSLSAYTSYYFRTNSLSRLNLANIPPYRLYSKNSSISGFEEENWSPDLTSFMTSGAIWNYYGYIYNPPVGSSSTILSSATDHRLFTYLGGTRKKKKSRMPFKTYDFSVSGDENNADAVINTGGVFPMDYYYRKVAVSELALANMPDLRLYQKNNFVSGFSQESWSPLTAFFNPFSGVLYSEGYLWISYGYKSNGTYYNNNCNNATFKLLLYSDAKRKKKKLKKQYVKRYVFAVSGDENNADKIVSSTSGSYTMNSYYRKVAISGLKMADALNFSVFRNSSTASSTIGEAYSDAIYNSTRITDGYLWILYGTKSVNNQTGSGTYIDSGNATYRVFVYK